MTDPVPPDHQDESKSPIDPELAKLLAEVYRLQRPYYHDNLQNQIGEEVAAIKKNGHSRPPRS
jgi:hypothetical protein